MNSHEVFIHIHQGCFPGTRAIVRLPQCQWSKPDGHGKISQCITTTKHSKAKTVCIFLGIYCTCYWMWLASPKNRDNLCLHWVWLVFASFPETSCLWKAVPVSPPYFFVNALNVINIKHNQNLQKSMQVQNLNAVRTANINYFKNVLQSLFSSVILLKFLGEQLMQACSYYLLITQACVIWLGCCVVLQPFFSLTVFTPCCNG